MVGKDDDAKNQNLLRYLTEWRWAFVVILLDHFNWDQTNDGDDTWWKRDIRAFEMM